MTLKPGSTRGSIEDVAQEAGVSRSTASRVLRGLMKVMPETRDRIFAAAEKVAYRPNVMARALRTGQMQTVALVLTPPQLTDTLFGDAIAALKTVLAEKGLKLTVAVISEEEDPQETFEELCGWCSALAIPGNLVRDTSILFRAGIPVTLLDWILPAGEQPDGICSIGYDQSDGIRQAVEHLVSIGHRNIAYIGSAAETQSFNLRERGFRTAMEQALLPVRPEWLFRCTNDQSAESVNAAFEQAISGARCRLSGIVCATDSLALDIVAAIRRHGKQVPDDFSVIGYGNSITSRLSNPQLTTIGHSGHDLGTALARVILHSGEGNSIPPLNIVLPAQLILRDTTAPRRGHINFSSTPGSMATAHERTGSQQILPDGIYELEASHSGMLLDVPNAARTPGCHVWQWQRNGSTAQLWYICHDHDGWYRLRNVGSWLFLDADASMPENCPVVTNPMNEQSPDIQLWKPELLEPGSSTYRITNKAKGLVVDFAYGSLVSNELVIVFPWNGATWQQWNAQRIPFLTDEYEIVALHSSMALDIPGQSRAVGIVPCQSERTRTLGQRWRLIHRGAACYQIQSMLSNLVLQASRHPAPRVSLTQNDPEAGDAQLWRIEPADISQASYRFVSKALDMVLEISGGQHVAGTSLHVGEKKNASHQQWLIYDDDSEAG